MTERDWTKASDEEFEVLLLGEDPGRELARRYLARGEELRDVKENAEIFEREADHFEKLATERGEEIERLREENKALEVKIHSSHADREYWRRASMGGV